MIIFGSEAPHEVTIIPGHHNLFNLFDVRRWIRRRAGIRATRRTAARAIWISISQRRRSTAGAQSLSFDRTGLLACFRIGFVIRFSSRLSNRLWVAVGFTALVPDSHERVVAPLGAWLGYRRWMRFLPVRSTSLRFTVSLNCKEWNKLLEQQGLFDN